MSAIDALGLALAVPGLAFMIPCFIAAAVCAVQERWKP